MTSVVINLRTEDERFIESAMKDGRYASESALIADGIAELRAKEKIRIAEIEEMRAAVVAGIDQADRGDFIDFTAEEVISERRGRLAHI